MNFTSPDPTPYDLNFRLFGIAVRVHPFFWLMAAVLGWGLTMDPNDPNSGFLLLFLWIACVFFSILLHEMGHVVVGNIFHSRGYIVLWGFGGLAVGSNRLHNRWQRVAVSFAGPLAQLLLYGALVLVEIGFESGTLPRTMRSVHLDLALEFLMYINLAWPLLNLLPIWPLDGGMIARELFEAASPREGVRRSLIVSAVVAGGLALLTLLNKFGHRPLNHPFLIGFIRGGTFMIIFYAMFAIQSIQLLQQMPPSRRDYDDDDHLPWERQRPEPWERESDSWKR